jgi:serine/threonine protein kinase/Tol biopolymer transport system component
MGEVYRARDAHLNREVAIKVLPDMVAADPDRLARFVREAQTLGALNHPNIAQLYGFEASANALVMELVPGDDLSVVMARGPIAAADALPIARQIADALEAAHDQGIIHRDLKPANIKVRADGAVKVLDFGLAKAVEVTEGGGGTERRSAENSPTLTARATQLGMILGTAAYMAPEQAKGKAVDKRADIWAFGVVLYEMLSGRRAFEGEDASTTMAAVLMKDPDWSALPASTPPVLHRLIHRCLERDPKLRLRDIGEARILISGPEALRTENEQAPAPVSASRGFVWPAVALVTTIAAIAFAAVPYFKTTASPAPVHFAFNPPEGVTIGAMPTRISPDGRKLAYGGIQGPRRLIFVYSFDTGVSTPVAGTEDFQPAVFTWSPASDALAFTSSDHKLKWTSVSGGSPQMIVALDQIFSGTWGADDVILLGPANQGPTSVLMKVKVSGGKLEPATTLDGAKGETGHRGPTFLPDGRHYTFYVAAGAGNRTAYVGSIDSTDRRPLEGIASRIDYSPTGHLFFLRDRALMAQPFDLKRFELTGTPALLIDGLAASNLPFSVSNTGTLVYRVTQSSTFQFAWFDRTGKEIAKVGPPSDYNDIELSRDDRYVAYESGRPGDIWALDLQNGVPQQVTSHPEREADPVWSPDGRTIAFRSDAHNGQLFTRAFGVVGEDVGLHKTGTRDSPASWSKDGKYLAFETQNGVWALPLTGERKPFRVTQPTTTGSQGNSEISPDGRWLVYQSGELTGQNIFVQSFPNPGAKQRVSPDGGTMPRWSHDGREIFYVSPSRTLMSVAVTATASSIDAKSPVPLFALPVGLSGEHAYAVSSTGRFLISMPAGVTSDPPVTVILNWRQ